MNAYKEALTLLAKQFGDNDIVYFATLDKNGDPNLRPVNAGYDADTFYLVTNARSEKVREIEKNPAVAVSSGTFRAWGEAENLGSPLDSENAGLKDALKSLCAKYKQRFGSLNENACVVRVSLLQAAYMHGGTEYTINFEDGSAEKSA
jgi:hypothetical protein